MEFVKSTRGKSTHVVKAHLVNAHLVKAHVVKAHVVKAHGKSTRGKSTRGKSTRGKSTRGKSTRGKSTRGKSTRGKSTRGNKDLLVLDGFVYSPNKISAAGVISWECVERRNAKSCMAKMKTLNGVEVGRFHQHTHAPDHENIRVLKIKADINTRIL